MKLSSERRCPWCGETVDDIKGVKERYPTKECTNCGKKYSFHYKSSIFLFSDFILVLLLIGISLAMIKRLFLLIVCAVLIIAALLLRRISPYEMYDDDGVPIMRKYRAKLTFNQKDTSPEDALKIRLFLMEKAIISICFSDGGDTLLSDAVCISIESARRISAYKYECTFSFLPLSPVSYDVSKTSDFFILDSDKKNIGKGKIMADYNKFV